MEHASVPIPVISKWAAAAGPAVGWAVLAVQSGDRVIEVAHQLGVSPAEPAQLHAFSCPVL